MAKGKIIIVSGFSGTGKGTVINEVMSRTPDRYAFSVSATTRPPRPGEIHGKDYYFVDETEFERMIIEKELLEHTRYNYNYYGTPKAPVQRMLSEGKSFILDIEVEGMHQVTSNIDGAMTAFLVPPSFEALLERLRGRGTETADQIRTRLGRAVQEAAFACEYGAVIENADIKSCADELEAYIATGVQDESVRQKNLILSQEICEAIKRFIKQGELSS